MSLNVYVDSLALLIVFIIGNACRKRLDGSYEYRLFFSMIVVIAATLISDLLGCAFDNDPSRASFVYVTIAVYFFFRVIYSYLWLLFTLALCSGGRVSRRRSGLLFLPALAEIIVILLNFRTDWLFSFDHTGYTRGVLYWPHLFIFGFYVAAAIVSAVYWYAKSRDTDRRRLCLYSLLYLFLPVCGAVLEVINSDISWTFPFAALSQLMMFLNFREHEETILQRQLIQNRINIMLSQIQPHFLYNALEAVGYLCEVDPPKAEKAVTRFSMYLRGNMESLTNKGTIPFEQELAHTQNYLYLEKARFEDRLNVTYDIAATNFRLPPLTLQPIVENAVRYGVTKREDGGTVNIASEETQDAFIVTVSDDGVGFDPMKPHEDGRTHIGIQNVRERVRRLLRGTLEILSTPDVGTVATITIPKEVNKRENTGTGRRTSRAVSFDTGDRGGAPRRGGA